MVSIGTIQAQTDSTIRPGVIPVNYPVINSTSSLSGEFVLTPSRAFIDKSFEEGKQSMFIFYQNIMAEPDSMESKVKQISKEVQIPNSLIIPIPAGQTARKGDIVLTSWQSGSGMQRAMVVDDKNQDSPLVHYLDISWDNPAKNKEGVLIGQMTELLPPNTFVVLTQEWQAGRTVIYKDGNNDKMGILIHSSGDQVLLLAWSYLVVVPREKCFPVIPLTEIDKDDVVYIPLYGNYKQATVTRVDIEKGRVWVNVEFAGKQKEVVASITDIVSKLPE